MEHIFNRHCAKVILSFGICEVVPTVVFGPIPEFITKWVITPLSLADIVGLTMTVAHVDASVPIFSSEEFGHFTIIKNTSLILGGHAIVCNTCPEGNLGTSSAKLSTGRMWMVKCKSCQCSTTYKEPDEKEIAENDKEIITRVPGGTGLFCVPYPPPPPPQLQTRSGN